MTAVADAPAYRVPAEGDLGAVLAVLREHTAALVASAPQPLSRIRVEAAGIVVELDWPGGPAPERVAEPVLVPAPVASRGTTPVSDPAVSDSPVAAPPPTGHRLTAPTVGVFYRSPEPGAPPFVGEGDRVVVGQQMAIIEAMKLMIPVEADRAGRVTAVLCDDATSVEFGQPLFALADA